MFGLGVCLVVLLSGTLITTSCSLLNIFLSGLRTSSSALPARGDDRRSVLDRDTSAQLTLSCFLALTAAAAGEEEEIERERGGQGCQV